MESFKAACIGVALCGLLGVCRSAGAAEDSSEAIEEVDFGRPCADPQPAFDPKNPADRMTRKSPHSDPATPLTQPPYPAAARAAGMEGSVVLALLINEEGQVSRARIRKGSRFPMLNAAALEGTRNWKLRPGMAQGQPVCMWGDFAVQFMLGDYFDSELSKVSVGRDAERLATLLLSAESFDDMMYSEVTFTAQELAVIDASNRAFLANSEWQKTRHRTAAILASEFSPSEIEVLLKFQETPVAAKMRALQPKLAPAIAVEASTSVLAFACETAHVSVALKQEDASKVFDGEQMSKEYARRIAEYADLVTSYCFCRARWESDAARGIGLPEPACGDAPVFASGHQ